ncbi:hypothetical protein [Curtobacterium flaccumfaciens]|uniref:hypothetical protein n=1 Tax=Curtobacterium flaccumfaciens TaxID=2035 RepID=UPI00220B8E90|nr:hypothetical protein [Curtobacterium flaccumfaciens]UWD77590.1 hypothetical protein NY058_09050 [Curtobacterium flaccumfaciens]
MQIGRRWKRARRATTPVLFHKVCEWQRNDRDPGDVVIERGVWLASTARRVAVYEFDGRDTHASVHQLDEVLEPQWQDKIDEAPAAWLLTHLERFASGVDVRRAVLDDYALRHGGGSPPTIEWAIRL